MNRPKKTKTTNLKYISEERKREVEQVFDTLGLMNQGNVPNNFHPSEGYSIPFKQFSVLKNEKIIFSSSS